MTAVLVHGTCSRHGRSSRLEPHQPTVFTDATPRRLLRRSTDMASTDLRGRTDTGGNWIEEGDFNTFGAGASSTRGAALHPRHSSPDTPSFNANAPAERHHPGVSRALHVDDPYHLGLL